MEVKEIDEQEVTQEKPNGGYEESTEKFLERVHNIPNDFLTEVDKRRLLEVMGYNPYGKHPLRVFNAVGKCRSVFRAIRRGHVSVDGQLFPKRPFNNRKDRELENRKKSIYNEYKRHLAIQS